MQSLSLTSTLMVSDYGWTELLRLIAGIDRPDSGTVEVQGKTIASHNPRQAIVAGLGLLSEERKRDGILRDRPVTSNVALPSFRKFARRGWIRRKLNAVTSLRILRDMNLRPLAIDKAIGTFSEGNQQKVIIGRWLAASANFMLFDEPIRGIGVGAKAEIYALIEKLASDGKTMIVVSSEMPELMRLADRVLVMCEGRITRELRADQYQKLPCSNWPIPTTPAPNTPKTARRDMPSLITLMRPSLTTKIYQDNQYNEH